MSGWKGFKILEIKKKKIFIANYNSNFKENKNKEIIYFKAKLRK